jgi:hypothetical protein
MEAADFAGPGHAIAPGAGGIKWADPGEIPDDCAFVAALTVIMLSTAVIPPASLDSQLSNSKK